MVTPTPINRARMEFVAEDANTVFGSNYQAIQVNVGSLSMSTLPFTRVKYDSGMSAVLGGWTDNLQATQVIDGTNNTMSVTIPEDGLWAIDIGLPEFSPTQTNDRPFIVIAVNGVAVEAFDDGTRSVSGTDAPPMRYTTRLQLAQGDLVQAGVYIEGGQPESAGFNDLTSTVGATLGTGDTVTSFFDIEQLSTSTVVLPDALTPTPLDYATLGLDSNQALTTIGDKVVWDTLDAHAGTGVAHAAGDIILTGAGLWSIRSYMLGNYAGSGRHVYTLKDSGGNIIVAGSDAGGADNRFDEIAFEAIVGPGTYYIDANSASAEVLGNTVASGLDRSTLVIQKLPTDSVVAYDPGEVEAKALADDFVELSANQNFTAAYSDVLTLDLPEAGRYRVHAKVAAAYDTNAAPNYARLYNTTTGTEILGTEITLGDTDVATGNWQGTFSTEKVITVTGPTTVALQAKGATIGANEMYSNNDGNTSLAYEQLPTLEVVTPGDVPVQPVEYIEDRQTAATVNQPLITTFNDSGLEVAIPSAGDWDVEYNAVAYLFSPSPNPIYGRYRMTLDGSAITDPVDVGSNTINVAGMQNSANVNAHDSIRITTTGPATLRLQAAASGSPTTHTMEIGSYLRATRAITHTVVDPGSLPVDDQTASGYFDFGTMRMQWGRATTSGGGGGTPATAVVVYPAAFAAAAESIQLTCGQLNDPRSATYHSESATGFTVDTWKSDDRTGASVSVSWFAIGLKP